jgi:hypothetical protein
MSHPDHHITREEEASLAILHRESPSAIWVMMRIVAISGYLSRKREETAGWIARMWGWLLALQQRSWVRKLELKLLSFWYAWLRFNPQETAKKQDLLLSNSMKDQLVEVKSNLEASKKGVKLVLFWLVLTILVGLGGELGSRALVRTGGILLKITPVSPDLLWTLVARVITVHMFVTVILLAIAITTFIYWAGRTIVGWWDYHKTVLRVKEMSQRD